MPLFLFFIAILAFMYLVLVRPQQQRLRKQQALVRSVAVGEYVVLQSGIVGRIADETSDRLQLEIADGVLVEVLKVAVFRRMEPSELAFTAVAPVDGDAGDGEAGDEGGTEETDGSDDAEAGVADDRRALEEGELDPAGGGVQEEGAEGERT